MRYTAEVEHIAYLDDEKSTVMSAVVSVYGDLPRGEVTNKSRNAVLRAAGKVVSSIPGVSAMDWEDIRFRVAVNNGQERHEVVFEPPVSALV